MTRLQVKRPRNGKTDRKSLSQSWDELRKVPGIPDFQSHLKTTFTSLHQKKFYTWDAGWEALHPSKDTNEHTLIGRQGNIPGTGGYSRERICKTPLKGQRCITSYKLVALDTIKIYIGQFIGDISIRLIHKSTSFSSLRLLDQNYKLIIQMKKWKYSKKSQALKSDLGSSFTTGKLCDFG